jgi:plasmid stabilization system protein ParE
LRGIRAAIFPVRQFPLGFSTIPEQLEHGPVYRQVHYYSHRVIYRFDESKDTVHIVAVWHSSRDGFRLSDED